MAHRRRIRAVGAATAFAGAAINWLLDPRLVLIGFAAVMVAAGVQMLREQTTVGGSCALPGGGLSHRINAAGSAPGSPASSSPSQHSSSPKQS